MIDTDTLVKMTANLTPTAADSLHQAADLTGDTRTDVVNRALIVYAAIHRIASEGGGEVKVDDIEVIVYRPTPSAPAGHRWVRQATAEGEVTR